MDFRITKATLVTAEESIEQDIAQTDVETLSDGELVVETVEIPIRMDWPTGLVADLLSKQAALHMKRFHDNADSNGS